MGRWFGNSFWISSRWFFINFFRPNPYSLNMSCTVTLSFSQPQFFELVSHLDQLLKDLLFRALKLFLVLFSSRSGLFLSPKQVIKWAIYMCSKKTLFLTLDFDLMWCLYYFDYFSVIRSESKKYKNYFNSILILNHRTFVYLTIFSEVMEWFLQNNYFKLQKSIFIKIKHTNY